VSGPAASLAAMRPQFNAISLIVADLSAAQAFYGRLGLTFTVMDDHAEVELPGGVRLMLDAEAMVKSFHPDWQRPVGSPQIHLAFGADSPDQVDAVYADLIGAGHRGVRAPWDAFWGQRYATVLDPDGNGVDLYAALDPDPRAA